MSYKKKISPNVIFALKEALSVIFWKKNDLKDFIKLSIDNKAIINTVNWDTTKRETVKELIERMINRQDIYEEDLLSLIHSVSDFDNYSHLKYWDDDGSKTKRAKTAVKNLRSHTKGFIKITQEQEEAKKRRVNFEENLKVKKSLKDEINSLSEKFNQIAVNENFQERGYQFEKFLIELFLLYELDPKGSFKNKGEQIDGAFTHEGTDYLLEAKWKSRVDRNDLASFSYKVESKLKISMGLFISVDGLTSEAISPDFKSIIICDGADLNAVLENRISLPDLIYKKRRKAVESGDIYVKFKNL